MPTCSELFYAALELAGGASYTLRAEHEQRGIYVIDGEVSANGTTLPRQHLAVATDADSIELRARTPTRLMLLGGAKLDGERHIWWNFVASSPERIERAKSDWKEGRFAVVPGDEREFIPLPEG